MNFFGSPGCRHLVICICAPPGSFALLPVTPSKYRIAQQKPSNGIVENVMQTIYNAMFGKKKNVDNRTSTSTADLENPSAHSSSATVQSTTLQKENKDWDLIKQQVSGANYKELKLLGREGFPDALRPWIWAKITKVDSLAVHERNYDAALRRTFGGRVPVTQFQPPSFGAVLPKQVNNNPLSLTNEQALHYKYLLCIIGHDSPHLEFIPMLPAVTMLLVKEIQDNSTILGCIKALIKGHQKDTGWSYIPVQKRDNVLMDRILLDLVAQFIPSLAKHLKRLRQQDPEWTSDAMSYLLSGLFIGILELESVVRVFDCFVVEGSKVLMRFALACLMLKQSELLACKTPAEFDACLLKSMQPHSEQTFKTLSKTALKKISFSRKILFKFRERHRRMSLDAYDSEDRRMMLHRPLPHIKEHPSYFLNDSDWQVLWSWIPLRFRLMSLELVFTTAEHGLNLGTLYQKCEAFEPTLLVIETGTKAKIGAFLSRCLKQREQADTFFGTGETFVFSLSNTDKPDTPSIYHWHYYHAVTSFILATNDMLAIGGSAGAKETGFGLWFERDMRVVYSSPCNTFKNESLLGGSLRRDDILNLEVFKFV